MATPKIPVKSIQFILCVFLWAVGTQHSEWLRHTVTPQPILTVFLQRNFFAFKETDHREIYTNFAGRQDENELN